MSDIQYDFTHTLEDCDAGVFLQKVSRAIADASLAAVEFGDKGKKAKVVLEFTISRIGESHQVNVNHKITSVRPTRRGKLHEEDATATAFYVASRGMLSIIPKVQADLFSMSKKETA